MSFPRGNKDQACEIPKDWKKREEELSEVTREVGGKPGEKVMEPKGGQDFKKTMIDSSEGQGQER